MLIDKLRGRAGESLVEALAAILVIALSAAMVVGASVAAARMNTAADEATKTMNDELTEAESGSGSAAGTVSAGGVECDVKYTGGSGKLTSYRY